MSSLSPLNSEPSFLAILNLLCPHYLWTDGFLDLLSFNPSELSYSNWFYHVSNLWIIFSHISNFFREFYLVNARPFEHPKQFKVFRNPNHPIGIYENFEGGFVDTQKWQNLRQFFNRSEWCLTCRHLQKTSRRQADDQFYPSPREKSTIWTLLIQWSRQ